MDREINEAARERNDGDNSNIRDSRRISNPAGKELIRVFLPPLFIFFLWMGMGEGDAEGQIVHPR
jgi:hypothetical protein